jgi:ABC-2 type transport system permease protein
MSTASTIHDFQQGSTPTLHSTQPFLWAVRRELWEFRSIYIAPLGVAILALFAFVLSMAHMSRQMHDAAALDAMQQAEFIQRPYNLAALFLMGISFVVAIFYSLEALSTERRDRSILFWKSLPVSDFTTVLTKFSIPIIVLPLIAIVLTVATNLIMLLLNIAVLVGSRQSLDMLWSNLPLARMWAMQAYHMFILHGLWFAPVYGWLLLVSAWARRLAIIWAAVPFVAIGVVEKMLLNSAHFGHWMMYRFGGAPASDAYPGGHMSFHAWSHLHFSEVFFSPGLWTGLIFAVLCLFAAARLRRSRGPV